MSASPSPVQDQRDERERREAEVVAEHLPAGYTAAFDGVSSTPPLDPSSSASGSDPALSLDQDPPPPSQVQESSLLLQGGDIHRPLYKLNERAQMPQHRRAATIHDIRPPSPRDGHVTLTVDEHLAPQGFRRAFLFQRLQDADDSLNALPITRNFVDFLDLYGSFAGEDLRDFDDEEDETEEEGLVGERGEHPGEEDGRPPEDGETRPLLGRRKSTKTPARSANASTGRTFATLLKAFIGTGIMFLPKAFNNGGILFSTIAMLVVSAISMWAFHLLLACKKQYGGGYGDIGQAVAGKPMRNLILGSITLSQLGFVCAGIVFVAENLLSFSQAVSGGTSPINTTTLIGIQVLALIPLAWIRNISRLGPAAQIADVFIAIGLCYIFYYDISELSTRGISKTVVLFNPDKYTLTIGSAIFTFEGIGLILPIQSSMRDPRHFEQLLAVVMLIITVVFTAVGALCYATFGAGTDIEVINNFPQDSRVVNAVQFLYAVAVMIGTPVQLFPALRVLEANVFGTTASGKRSRLTKWGKNAFRAALVALCALIAVWGAGNLDFFVALIGSFACIPLVYIYPPYLHYKGIAQDAWMKAADLALMGVGAVGMVYTTVVTVKNR